MKPILLLDLDHTLLDTRKLGVLAGIHLREKLRQAVGAVKECDWRTLGLLMEPELQGLTYLLLGIPRNFLTSPASRRSFLNPDYYRRALYPDVRPALKRLKERASLGIFSQGLTSWQLAKLHLSGIDGFFDPALIFVFPGKINKAPEVLSRLPPSAKIYFVDDRADIVETLANHRVKAFLIRRDPQPELNNGPMSKIRSLKELPNLI